VLLGTTVPAAFHQQLAQHYTVVGPVPQPFSANLAGIDQATRESVRALVTIGSVQVPRTALDLLPNLGLASFLGSGYEGIDLPAARARNITVTHGADVNASAVADLAMGLVIASVRGFRAGDHKLRSGTWQGNSGTRMPARHGLTGRNIGIFGLGAIGRRIALRAAACEMHVGYFSRHARSDVGYRYCTSLAALADWCDVLVVAVRADHSTRHAVDRAILARLGADGHVVNIARGSVIDETALIAALTDGTLGGAGLDVYEHEPTVPQALLDLPNVFTTPHLGGSTREALDAMFERAAQNLAAFFAGRPALTPIPA
jgi:glyoxylate reductase